MDETRSISSRKWKEWTGFTLEIRSIRIARFLVRVQVEEQIQGIFPKKRPRPPYLGLFLLVIKRVGANQIECVEAIDNVDQSNQET
jgi:hypothetical protein